MNQYHLTALGTKWWLKWQEIPKINAAKVIQEIEQSIQEFEQNYSRFREDSLVSELNTRRELAKPTKELIAMLDFGIALYEASGGAFNIGLGGELERRGYDAALSFHTKGGRSEAPELKVELSAGKIALGEGVKIDFGGFGKGWLVDKVANLLLSLGSDGVLVNAGGDIRVAGEHQEEILLEHPGATGQSIGKIKVREAAVACSATNRRRWIDAQTGQELHHLITTSSENTSKPKLAVFTYAKTALLADAMSTGIFVTADHQTLVKKYPVEYIIVYTDFSYIKSKNYPGHLN